MSSVGHDTCTMTTVHAGTMILVCAFTTIIVHVLQSPRSLAVEAMGSGGALPPQGSRGVWEAASPPMVDSVLGEPSSGTGGTGSPRQLCTVP